jgi:thiamine biosynthesis lipoprotein
MTKSRSLLGIALLFASATSRAGEPKRFEFTELRMGTTARVVLYAPDEATAKTAAKAAFARVAELNRIMSDYDSDSELMRLCAANAKEAGKPVKVSPELFFVLSKGQEVARLSDGAFDMTVGPLVRLWRLSRRTQRLPEEKELADARARVGYRKLELNERERNVRLLTPRMLLDLGGIAKGYAADEMLAVLKQHGITQALAALGGDIAVGDSPPGTAGWKIDVAPLTKAKPTRTLSLANAAVSTSGDAEQYTLINGVRYSHIVDPRTGLGQTGRRSVTVVARHGITSDSMTKAVALLEPDKALALIEQSPAAAALIVLQTDHGEEELKSKRFAQYLAEKAP